MPFLFYLAAIMDPELLIPWPDSVLQVSGLNHGANTIGDEVKLLPDPLLQKLNPPPQELLQRDLL